jgi:hypothetical protein
VYVNLLPASGGPGFENEYHFQNALRAKDLHMQIVGKSFTNRLSSVEAKVLQTFYKCARLPWAKV